MSFIIVVVSCRLYKDALSTAKVIWCKIKWLDDYAQKIVGRAWLGSRCLYVNV